MKWYKLKWQYKLNIAMDISIYLKAEHITIHNHNIVKWNSE